MAVYTTELRTLIENGFDIGLKEYPIFDESYRAILNKKIIGHYYTCEIGAETAGLFKLYLNRKMAEIMPYYNQLYRSELLEFDPLTDYNRVEETEGGKTRDNEFTGTATDSTEESSTTTNDLTTTGEGLTVNSDTPQGMLAIGDIKNNTYASAAGMDETETHNTGTVTNSGTKSGTGESSTTTNETQSEWLTRHISGKTGAKSFSEMLNEYRSTFINIDMMIIKELAKCFMLIY